MSTITHIIGESLRKQRESQNLSQGELARRMGVDPSYISTLEGGRRNISIQSLAKIASVLEIPVFELLEPLRYFEKNSETMPYMPGIIAAETEKWLGRSWYHQRFDGSPYLLHMIAEAEIITRREEKDGLAFDQHFCFFEEGKADWYIDIEEIDRITKKILGYAISDPHISKKLIVDYENFEKKFYEACNYIGKKNLYDLSNQELIKLHNDFLATILERNSSSSIIDGFALGSDRLLEEKINIIYKNTPQLQKKFTPSEIFSKLTTPAHSSFIREAELDLFKLIQQIRKNNHEKPKLIRRYQERYFWIRNNYVDSHALTPLYFEEEIARIESSELDVDEEIQRLESMPENNAVAKKEILSHITLDSTTQFLLEVTEDFTGWQDDRKKATMFTAHYTGLLLEEISRRINVNVELLKYLSPREVSDVFTNIPSNSVLEERRRNSVIYWNQDGHEVVTGARANQIRLDLLGESISHDIEDFRGMTAALGKAEGRVKVIRSVKEIGRVEQGDILVAVMTRPDYVPAMKKAAAIVTDEGGITSHAAIVSRELKIPCVIGTKIATQVLHDGDLVQVNANHGLVKIIKKAND